MPASACAAWSLPSSCCDQRLTRRGRQCAKHSCAARQEPLSRTRYPLSRDQYRSEVRVSTGRGGWSRQRGCGADRDHERVPARERAVRRSGVRIQPAHSERSITRAGCPQPPHATCRSRAVASAADPLGIAHAELSPNIAPAELDGLAHTAGSWAHGACHVMRVLRTGVPSAKGPGRRRSRGR